LTNPDRPRSRTKEFEDAVAALGQGRYVLKLYVTGSTPRSANAVANLKRICEEHLKGRYDLEVIDIYQQPTLAKGEQIIAAPTLVKKLPPPLRKLIGDMSDTERVLLGLDIREKKVSPRRPGRKAAPEDA
jgi:circadian clock protein KaiB